MSLLTLAIAGLGWRYAESVATHLSWRRLLLAAYAVGRYALPPVEEMEQVIDEDNALYLGHVTDRPRHTQQVDYFVYEHDLRTKELPDGIKRGERQAQPVAQGAAR